MLALRLNGSKEAFSGPVADFGAFVSAKLAAIQDAMLAKATAERNAKLKVVMEWKDFVPALNDKCLCLTPFCDESEVGRQADARLGLDVLAQIC